MVWQVPLCAARCPRPQQRPQATGAGLCPGLLLQALPEGSVPKLVKHKPSASAHGRGWDSP